MNLEDDRILLNNLASSREVTAHILAMTEEKKLLIIGLLWAWWDARNKANAESNEEQQKRWFSELGQL